MTIYRLLWLCYPAVTQNDNLFQSKKIFLLKYPNVPSLGFLHFQFKRLNVTENATAFALRETYRRNISWNLMNYTDVINETMFWPDQQCTCSPYHNSNFRSKYCTEEIHWPRDIFFSVFICKAKNIRPLNDVWIWNSPGRKTLIFAHAYIKLTVPKIWLSSRD